MAAPARQPLPRRVLVMCCVLALACQLAGVDLLLDRYFLTFLHEASHGLAAVLTGGQLHSFTIAPNGSGLALTVGGFRPLVLVAGYLGACLWGGALLIAARQTRWAGALCLALAGFFAVFTLAFVRNPFGWLVGSALAALFGLAWRHGSRRLLPYLLAFLAARASLTGLGDLWTQLRLAGNCPMTDAGLMSRELTFGLVPAWLFALGIALISITAFAGCLAIALGESRAGPRVLR